MGTNLQSVLGSTSGVTAGISALSGLVAVSPQFTVGYQPQNVGATTTNGNTLLFHYEGEQTVLQESDITDHYVEDNTALQDQIAIKPVTITTHGFIGELNDIAPFGLQTLQAIANKLITIGGYVPSISTTALLAYNEAAFAYSTVATAASSVIGAASSLSNFESDSSGQTVINGTVINQANQQNKQQTMFQQLYANQVNRILFTVQTPWAVFQNMAILSLRAVQDEVTNIISDFEVTFKQMRFATTIVNKSNTTQGQLQQQSASLTALGTQTLTSSVPFPSLGVPY